MGTLILIFLNIVLAKMTNSCCCQRGAVLHYGTSKCVGGNGTATTSLQVTFERYCKPNGWEPEGVDSHTTKGVALPTFFKMIEKHAHEQGLSWVTANDVVVLSMDAWIPEGESLPLTTIKLAIQNCVNKDTDYILRDPIPFYQGSRYVCGRIFKDSTGTLQIYDGADVETKIKKWETERFNITFVIGKKCKN